MKFCVYFNKEITRILSNAGHHLFSSFSSVVVSHTALISSLAAAEARCTKLEQQLQHMRKMLLSVKADRHSMLKEQVRPSRLLLSCGHHQKLS